MDLSALWRTLLDTVLGPSQSSTSGPMTLEDYATRALFRDVKGDPNYHAIAREAHRMTEPVTIGPNTAMDTFLGQTVGRLAYGGPPLGTFNPVFGDRIALREQDTDTMAHELIHYLVQAKQIPVTRKGNEHLAHYLTGSGTVPPRYQGDITSLDQLQALITQLLPRR